MDTDSRINRLLQLKQQVFELYQSVSLVTSIAYFANNVKPQQFFGEDFIKSIQEQLQIIEGTAMILGLFGDSEDPAWHVEKGMVDFEYD